MGGLVDQVTILLGLRAEKRVAGEETLEPNASLDYKGDLQRLRVRGPGVWGLGIYGQFRA